MTKEDFVWVGIRVFGIYLLVLAVLAVPPLANSIHMVIQLSGHPASGGAGTAEVDAMDSMLGKLRVNYFGALITRALQLVVCILAGLYLLLRGQFVFRLASRPL